MSLDLDAIVARVEAISNRQELEALRVEYLGRQGKLTTELRQIGALPSAERAASGAELNVQRQMLEKAFAEGKKKLQHIELSAEIANSNLDITAPADTGYGFGHAHPVQSLIDELVQIFWQMGYTVVDGPEIETEWYNFSALNIPDDHPARDMQDTFYLEEAHLPRTHTSNVQIRYMEGHQPPIRIVAPGKVYRNEDEDQRHSWQFQQIEGLVVDKGIRMSDLKGTLLAMMRGVLGESTDIKLLPNFFPYTEPSVEMHATCPGCAGKGCRMCNNTGWLELGGAGMVHAKVLKNIGIDPEIYTGFAFGFGPERIAAIKHGVTDVREFWRPNLDFLEQF